MNLGQVGGGGSGEEKEQELEEEWAEGGADGDRMGLGRASISPKGLRKGFQ